MRPSVIWDWNGTLLDDVDVCVASINRLLARRSLEPMTVPRYLRMFTFPVQRYYEEMGFDFQRESFDEVAVEFHAAYEDLVPEAPLHREARSALERLHSASVRQVVLSALEEARLHNELKIRGIHHYFSHVFGLSDLHARSKAERGRDLLRAMGSPCDECWMIGDTDHDAEVAEAMGVRCILVSSGHQPANRLGMTGATVVESLAKAVDIVLGSPTAGTFTGV